MAIVSETDAAPAKRRAPCQPGTLVCATPRPLLNAPGRQLWDVPDLRIGLAFPLQPQEVLTGGTLALAPASQVRPALLLS